MKHVVANKIVTQIRLLMLEETAILSHYYNMTTEVSTFTTKVGKMCSVPIVDAMIVYDHGKTILKSAQKRLRNPLLPQK